MSRNTPFILLTSNNWFATSNSILIYKFKLYVLPKMWLFKLALHVTFVLTYLNIAFYNIFATKINILKHLRQYLLLHNFISIQRLLFICFCRKKAFAFIPFQCVISLSCFKYNWNRLFNKTVLTPFNLQIWFCVD